jgi:predicted nucleotidyltransferase component of viral defense system
MYYDILDKKRLDILPLFRPFKNDFYLAGGTALALYFGHRDSIDFDFFSSNDIDTVKLFKKIKEVFLEHEILKIQEEKNTLTVLIDNNIKLSFFTYKYDLLEKKLDEENLFLASIEDIACMKLSAVLGRASNKDYVDLYYILQKFNLQDILKMFKKKFRDIDINLVLKSLVYFDDIDIEPIMFKHNREVDFEKIKSFLIERVKML